MSQLKLNPVSTFVCEVLLPMPGGKAEKAEWTFRWHGRKAYFKLFDSMMNNEIEEADFILKIVECWPFEEELNKQNVETMMDYFPLSASAVFAAYREALFEAAEKN